MEIRKLSIIALLVVTSQTQAWDGTRADTGASIEVETYDHDGQGEGDVEYYENGEYKSGYLDMYPGGDGTITTDDSETFDVDMD